MHIVHSTATPSSSSSAASQYYQFTTSTNTHWFPFANVQFMVTVLKSHNTHTHIFILFLSRRFSMEKKNYFKKSTVLWLLTYNQENTKYIPYAHAYIIYVYLCNVNVFKAIIDLLWKILSAIKSEKFILKINRNDLGLSLGSGIRAMKFTGRCYNFHCIRFRMPIKSMSACTKYLIYLFYVYIREPAHTLTNKSVLNYFIHLNVWCNYNN